jgi:hypothetical protein
LDPAYLYYQAKYNSSRYIGRCIRYLQRLIIIYKNWSCLADTSEKRCTVLRMARFQQPSKLFTWCVLFVYRCSQTLLSWFRLVGNLLRHSQSHSNVVLEK